MYESLLLQYGGGIFPACQQSQQYGGAATVAIGIGGTGIAALAELKRQVYQELEPDNPGEPTPRYDHIRFLAIDSDEYAVDGMRGKARLNRFSEFFSISNPHLREALKGKDVIKNDPTLNWMEIDRIATLLNTVPTGVRQIGRYLLVRKAAALQEKLREICAAALNGLHSPHLNIYIFAGLSGSTGSGCFLDTCYIVRKVLEDSGWAAAGNIFGFFFLPDVVTSKPEVAAIASCVGYNYANGYAALKELDYHMDLKRVHDRFSQNYGAFSVDTQAPPVDLCHLISAAKPDGSLPPDGFRYATHLAADYVIAQLLDAPLWYGNPEFTMRRTQNACIRAPECLSVGHGANFSYHILGAASAEIPAAQIAAYLAAKFYERFQGCVGRDKAVLTQSMVDDWAQQLGVTSHQMLSELTDGTVQLYRLIAPLPSFDLAQAPTESLVGRVFCKLCDLCMDPQYGPYYAASLLRCQGYDLISLLDGAIRQAEEEQAAGGCAPYEDLIFTMCSLKGALSHLYEAFFAPLLRLLDNLDQTFSENLRYLDSDAAAPSPYAHRILELKDIRPKLDAAVAQCSPNEVVSNFMAHLLKGYDQWKAQDDDKIGSYINRYMEKLFSVQLSRSLDDYFFDLCPQADGHTDLLAEEIERDVLEKIHLSSLPRFWYSPDFDLTSPAVTYQSGIISVPRTAIAVCNAADRFKEAHHEYALCKTDLKNRIFLLKFFSGVPLYAYEGIRMLKNAYDQATRTATGVGIHLYAYTARGQDGSGERDWRDFLPVPAPYSNAPDLYPDGEETLALYEAAEQAGIIYLDGGYEYAIFQTGPLEVPTYTVDDFIQDGLFQRGVLERCREALKQQLDDIHRPGMGQEVLFLTDNGAPNLGKQAVTQVRKDHFLAAPRLQRIARAELQKRDALQRAIDALNDIERACDRYDTELGFFTDLIFYGILSCVNGSGKPCCYVKDGKGCHDKIFRIFYAYNDGSGAEQRLIFSQEQDDMPYARDYPLYQAFLTYRSLSPEEPPRKELDALVRERRKALLQPGDNVIGYILAQKWDRQALSRLNKDLACRPEAEKKSLVRFYLGLVRYIEQFRDKFSVADWRQLGPSDDTATSSARPKVWTVYDGSRYLYVYEDITPHFGWEQTTGRWVPLTADMYVWNADGNTWRPLTEDPDLFSLFSKP